MEKYKNDILELFATYKVFNAPDALVSALALYVKHQASLAIDDFIRVYVKRIKEASEEQA